MLDHNASIKSGKKENHWQTCEGCNLAVSLDRLKSRTAAEVCSRENQHLSVFVPSPLFLPVSHSERTILPSTVSKSRTSQSIRVCSSHFLTFSPCFFVSGILVTFSKCQILALRHYACAHTSPPPQNTHKHTHRAEPDTHTPRLEPGPCVLIYLREAGAWHRAETLVDSVLRLPMLLF